MPETMPEQSSEQTSNQCPKCGAYNLESQPICTACGHRLTIPADALHELSIRFSSARHQGIQLLAGFCASVGMTYLIYLITGFYPDSLVYRILYPNGYQIILPVIILFMTFWPFTAVLLKLVFLIRDTGNLPVKLSEPLRMFLLGKIQNTDRSRKLESTLMGWMPPVLFSRIRILSDAAGRQEDIERVDRRLEMEDSLEDAEIDRKYGVFHLFIWALPVLGFLGTVIGITLAVGDFSSFLGGNIDDIDLIKSELGNVTNGLSFAFGTTILGLAGALLVMLFTSIAQNLEDSLSNRVRRFTLEHLTGIVMKRP